MKTIWYIDDDKEMVQAIALMLKLLDYETKPFFDAREAARALLSGEKPTLIILDINMPKVSGIEFLSFVREQKRWDAIPILMLSSEASDVQVDEALEIGADGYLTKPVMVDELEDAISKALAARSG